MSPLPKLRLTLPTLETNYSVKIYPKSIKLYIFGKEILWSFKIKYKKIHNAAYIITWKNNVKYGSKNSR